MVFLFGILHIGIEVINLGRFHSAIKMTIAFFAEFRILLVDHRNKVLLLFLVHNLYRLEVNLKLLELLLKFFDRGFFSRVALLALKVALLDFLVLLSDLLDNLLVLSDIDIDILRRWRNVKIQNLHGLWILFQYVGDNREPVSLFHMAHYLQDELGELLKLHVGAEFLVDNFLRLSQRRLLLRSQKDTRSCLNFILIVSVGGLDVQFLEGNPGLWFLILGCVWYIHKLVNLIVYNLNLN